MSDELDQYLDSLPVHIFKISTGETIITKIVEEPPDDELPFIVSNPFVLEVELGPRGKGQIAMYEWLYGCDTTETFIDQRHVIAYHEAQLKMKNFYSKCVIRAKLDEAHDDLLSDLNENSFIGNPFEFMQSLLDGLEPKDSTPKQEEDILKPWRHRMQWRPSESPRKDDASLEN